MSRTFRRDPYHLDQGKTFRDGHFTMASTPGWWVNMHMNRPKRRKNTQLCRLATKGRADCQLDWPTGNRKPHEYYW